MTGSYSHPFSDSSLWNTTINSLEPTYTDPNAIQNVQFKDAGLANTWAQIEHLVYNTPSTAPTETWTFDTLNTTGVGGTFSNNGTIQLQTPTDLQFTNGSDGWAIFTAPDGIHSWEVWGGSYDPAAHTYHAGYLVENDVVNGTGWGQPDTGTGTGIRAAGASLLGGIVTQDELNNLSIQHALPIELDSHQLAAATGPTNAGQFVFPAVTADSDSVASYTGTIPMGAHFALPPNLDLADAGLTPEGLALAKAYQTYGGYVVDTAGHTTSLAEVEGGTPQQQADLFADLGWIRDHLVMTIDAGSGASNAAPQTNSAAQSDIPPADTHQASTVVDVGGGTSAAPADTGSSGLSAAGSSLGAATVVDVGGGTSPAPADTGSNGISAGGSSTGQDGANQLSVPHAQMTENAAHQSVAASAHPGAAADYYGDASSAVRFPTGADAAFDHHHAWAVAWAHHS